MEQPKKITKFFASEIKNVNENDQTVIAIVSTKKVDRDGDVINPDAFKTRLKHYKEHPVFLVNHRYDVQSIIGEAKSVKITENGLEATFKYFVGQGNPAADWAFNLAKNGIAAFSVGFIGHAYEPIVDKESKMTVGRTFTDVELIEISQVAVPSNRGALQIGRAAAMAELEVMEAVAKGFDDGTLPEQTVAPVEKPKEEVAPAAEVPAEEKVSVEADKHYSQEVLGDGVKNAQISSDEILKAIRAGFVGH